jgi:hypothetical protein
MRKRSKKQIKRSKKKRSDGKWSKPIINDKMYTSHYIDENDERKVHCTYYFENKDCHCKKSDKQLIGTFNGRFNEKGSIRIVKDAYEKFCLPENVESKSSSRIKSILSTRSIIKKRIKKLKKH